MLRKKQKKMSFPHVFSGNPEELDTRLRHSALPQCEYDNFTFFCTANTVRNIS
jgi:hypothetical protein